MKRLYEGGLDILGADHVVGRGGHGGGGHHGGGGRGFRGGGRFWGGGPWGWGYPDYDGDTYIVNMVDVDDDDEDDDVLGMIDVGARAKEMNDLKQPTVSIARVLLKYGQQAIDMAIVQASKPRAASMYLGQPTTLPGATARQEVKDHLQWHSKELLKYTDPNAFYPNADDLKKYVLAAYGEANAVEEGNAALDVMWGQMWAEIVDAISRLPKDIADKVSSSMPSWLKWTLIGGASAIGLTLSLALYSYLKK